MPDINTITLEQLYAAREKLNQYITKLQEAQAKTDIAQQLDGIVIARGFHGQYKSHLQTARANFRQYWVKAVIDPHDITTKLDTDILAWDETQLATVYTALLSAVDGCADPDQLLACLVNIDFVQAGVTETINTQIQSALKERIIDEVNRIVGFAYNGRDKDENALSIDPDAPNLRWDSDQVTAQALFSSIPFNYNRQAVAVFAKQKATNNFNGFPTTYAEVEDKLGDVGTGNWYENILTHRAGSTGSALFISESIYAGGLPMTTNPTDMPTNLTCTADYGVFENYGWRRCPIEKSATGNWRNHQGIRSYFPSFLGGTLLDTLLTGDDIVNVVYQSPATGVELAGKLKDDGIAHSALLSKLGAPPLNTLRAGDYLYIDNPSSGDNHGWIIVGWGPLLDTLDGINYAITNSLSIDRYVTDPNNVNPAQDHVIPYVVDFCFGTSDTPTQGTSQNPSRDSDLADERTGWLQDPRPRPFYSTRVDIIGASYLRTDQISFLKTIFYPPLDHFPPLGNEPKSVAYQRFNLDYWQPYILPDLVHVPFNRLYSVLQPGS